MGEIPFGAAANPAVDLLQRGAYPERIHAQLLKVIQFAGKPFQIAAVESTYLLHTIFMAAIAVVVGGVAIHEAIGQHEIDGGVLPAERRGFVRFGALKQQQAIAVGGWLKSHFAILNGRGLFAVKITHHRAFRERVNDVDRERFAVPLRALAGNVCDRLWRRTLYRQHQRRRSRARINTHLINAVTE